MSNQTDNKDSPHFPNFISSIGIDHNLALQFFLVFSWFEFALKNQGYYRRGRFDSIIIDWIRFGQEQDGQFNPDKNTRLSNAVEYLRLNSPRTQLIRDEEIVWDEVDPPNNIRTELGRLLFWVKMVRNNFFHGGKVAYQPDRDPVLLTSCLVVLQECIEIHEGINEMYANQMRKNTDNE